MPKKAANPEPSTSNVVTAADRERAKKIFERARMVADSGQYDYAIELFLDGLALDPDCGEIHKELRRIALTRKASGGKPLGGLKSMSLKRPSNDPKQALLNAEKLLAYDPGNVQHMLAVAKAAQKGGFRETAIWIGPLVLRSNLDGQNDTNTFLLLKDMYKEVGEYRFASEALGFAAASRPDDANLQHELRALAAQMTITQGGYGAGGDFRASVRDAERQRALIEEDMDVRDVEAMAGVIARARKEWEESDGEKGKLVKYIEALTKTENANHENEAIELLEKTFKETQSYRFRYMAEEIKIKQMARIERGMREQAEREPANTVLRKQLDELSRERLEEELKHFKHAMQAYPTELRHRYEVGKRLFDLERYSDSIQYLQQSQSDPKYREESGILLGRAFLAADFVDEAVDTLRGRIDSYQLEGDTRAKEMYYWYGRALETRGDMEQALKAYSQIAQWDFGYRDVQNRIRELRAKNK